MIRILVAAFMILAAGCSTRPSAVDLPAAQPGLELNGESYRRARSRFQTTLIRPGPAAAQRDPLVTPPGAIAVAYRSGGRTLAAFASPVPATTRRGAAVLFLHGGFSFGASHWKLAQPWQAAGFVVMMPTLRGENGQDGACSLVYDEVDDVLAAADALSARPDVDPAQLYLAGHSVGGTLTLLTALTSTRFRAAACFSAAPDLIVWSRGRPDQIPFPPDHPEEFRMRSAVAYATSFRCPVRLYFGADEFWLQPATHRTALLAQRAGLDVEAVELAGGHDSANPESIAAAIAFCRRH